MQKQLVKQQQEDFEKAHRELRFDVETISKATKLSGT